MTASTNQEGHDAWHTHNSSAHTKPRICLEPLAGAVDNVHRGPEPVCGNINRGLLLALAIRKSESPFRITGGNEGQHYWLHKW